MDPVKKPFGKVVTIVKRGMPPIELGITSDEELKKIATMSSEGRKNYLDKLVAGISPESIKIAGHCLKLNKDVELLECINCARTRENFLKLSEWDSCKATNLKNNK